MIFKVIVIGLLAWQLIQLVRRRKGKQNEPTYVIVPAERVQKDPTLFDQRGPPPNYYPPLKQ